MKQLWSILLLFLFFSCAKKNIDKVEITPELQQQLDAGSFLDDWHQAAANADFKAFFNAIAENGVYVGTDQSEVWTKEQFAAFAKPYFDRGKAWDFTPIERNMYFSETGELIWFNETIDTWMGVCRGSGVLKITNEEPNEFEIKQYVLSVTVPNEKIQNVINAIEAEE